jgi:hypothetical protein
MTNLNDKYKLLINKLNFNKKISQVVTKINN